MQNQVWCFTFANRHLPSWHMYLMIYANSANSRNPHGRSVFVVVKPISLSACTERRRHQSWRVGRPRAALREAPTVKFPCLITHTPQKFRPCSFIERRLFCERQLLYHTRRHSSGARVGASSGIRARMRLTMALAVVGAAADLDQTLCLTRLLLSVSRLCALYIERDDTCTTKAVLITYIYLKLPWIHT